MNFAVSTYKGDLKASCEGAYANSVIAGSYYYTTTLKNTTVNGTTTLKNETKAAYKKGTSMASVATAARRSSSAVKFSMSVASTTAKALLAAAKNVNKATYAAALNLVIKSMALGIPVPTITNVNAASISATVGGWPANVPVSCYPATTYKEEWECLDGACAKYEWRDEKSALTALLLGLFLGGLGIPYFYYGYWALGAVMLILTLLPCIFCCIACACGITIAGAGALSSKMGSGGGSGNGLSEDVEGGTEMGSPKGTGSGAGSGGDGDKKGPVEMAVQIIICCGSCVAMAWSIAVIVQVANYDITPQQSDTCLNKM